MPCSVWSSPTTLALIAAKGSSVMPPSAATSTCSPASKRSSSASPCASSTNKVAATTALSSTGSGAATLPRCRHTAAIALGVSAKPPRASGTNSPSQPSSAICRHAARSKAGLAPRRARSRLRGSARAQKSAALVFNSASRSDSPSVAESWVTSEILPQRGGRTHDKRDTNPSVHSRKLRADQARDRAGREHAHDTDTIA